MADVESSDKKRRSWFEQGRNIRFDIAVERSVDYDNDVENDIETLLLTPFCKPPIVDFGKVTVGTTKSCQLCIRNPHGYRQQVTIDKFPAKKRFSIDMTEFAVDAGAQVILTISWNPEEVGGCRETVSLRSEQICRLQFIIVAMSTNERMRLRKKSKSRPVSIDQSLRQLPLMKAGESRLQPDVVIECKENVTPGDVIVSPKKMTPYKSDLINEDSQSMNSFGTPVRRSTFLKARNTPPCENNQNLLNFEGTYLTENGSPVAIPDSLSTPVRRTTFVKRTSKSTPDKMADGRGSPMKQNSAPTSKVFMQFIHHDSTSSLRQVTNHPPGAAGRPIRSVERVVLSQVSNDPYLLKDVCQSPKLLEEKLLQLQERQTTNHIIYTGRPSRQTSPGSDVEYHSATFTKPSPQTSPDYDRVYHSATFTGRPSPQNSPSCGSEYHTATMTTPFDASLDSNEFQDSIMCAAHDSVLLSETLICDEAICGKIRSSIPRSAVIEFDATEEVICGSVVNSSLFMNTGADCFSVAQGNETYRVERRKDEIHLLTEIIEEQNITGEIFTSTRYCQDVPDAFTRTFVKDSSMSNIERVELKTSVESDQMVSWFEIGISKYDTVSARPSELTDDSKLASPHKASSINPLVQQTGFCSDDFPRSEFGGQCLDELLMDHDDRRMSSTPAMFKRDFGGNTLNHWLPRVSAPSPINTTSSTVSANRKNDFDDGCFRRPLPAVASARSHSVPAPNKKCNQVPSAIHTSNDSLSLSDSDHEPVVGRTFIKPKLDGSIGCESLGRKAFSRPLFGEENAQTGVKCTWSEGVVPLNASYIKDIDNSSSFDCVQSSKASDNSARLDITRQIRSSRDANISCGSLSDDDVVKTLTKRGASMFVQVGGQTSHMISPGQKRQSLIAKIGDVDNEKITLSHTNFAVPSDRRRSMQVDGSLNRSRSLNSSESSVTKKSIMRDKSCDSYSVTKLREQETVSNIKMITKRAVINATANDSVVSVTSRGRPGVAQSKLTLTRPATKTKPVKSTMPYSSRNMYYDERWMEKQESGFVKWLNFVLTPPEMYTDAKKQRVDVGSIFVGVDKDSVILAPSKEDLSLRAYNVRTQMNRLRRSSCNLFQSSAMVRVIEKLECEIETGRLAVRTDRMLHADLGIKQKILDMLLSYNPLWLRIGLETIYGEVLSVHGNGDVVGLSRFILSRLLGNPDIAAEYAHPSVRHLYKPGYQSALAKFTLKKFLLLVVFLDKAKSSHLIDYNPCLFCRDSDFKSSRDLLLNFSRDYLKGEGDLTRHLSYLGYTVCHTQSWLDEYNYAVTNLATDLRDGLKLTRLIEVLAGQWNLSSELRVPTISRLQKIHNVSIVFNEMARRGITILSSKGGKVEARDIVDGHRQKTLQLLWSLIFVFKVDVLLNEAELKTEISRIKRRLNKEQLNELLSVTQPPKSEIHGEVDHEEVSMLLSSPRLALLLEWCQTVCFIYKMKVDNFTVSFSDGRALCYLLHHYHPAVISLADIRTETSLSCGVGKYDFDCDLETPAMSKPEDLEQLFANERHNLKIFMDKVAVIGGVPVMLKPSDMCNTIPDEKTVVTYLSYLCARLFDVRKETHAAFMIQSAWRSYRNRHLQFSNNKPSQPTVCSDDLNEQVVPHSEVIAHSTSCQLQIFAEQHVVDTDIDSTDAAENSEEKHVKDVGLLSHGVSTADVEHQGTGLSEHVMPLSHAELQCTDRSEHLLPSSHAEPQRPLMHLMPLSDAEHQGTGPSGHVRPLSHAELQCTDRSVHLLPSSYAEPQDKDLLMHLLPSSHAEPQDINPLMHLKPLSDAEHQGYFEDACHVTDTIELKIVADSPACVMLDTFEEDHAIELCNNVYIKSAEISSLEVFVCCQDSAMISSELHVRSNDFVTCSVESSPATLTPSFNLQTTAATKIQAIFRGYVARKSYVAQQIAFGTIQRCWRGSRNRLWFHVMRGAVITIQCNYRGYRCRRRYIKMLRSACVIQSWYRGVVGRRHFFQLLNGLCSMQRLARALLVCNDQVARRKSAVRIQAVYRAHRQKEAYKAAMKVAADFHLGSHSRFLKTIIAAAVPGVRYDDLVTVARLSAAAAIRAAFTAYRYRKLHVAAEASQRALRALPHKMRLQTLRAASIVIQRRWRAFKYGREVRNQYLWYTGAIIVVQSVVRRFLARCYCRQLRQQKEVQLKDAAAVKIQSVMRSVVERCRFLAMKRAAIVIQRCYLDYRQRKLMKIESATRIQSLVRMISCRRRYGLLLSRITSLQRLSKAYVECEHFCNMRKSAVVVQRLWRMKQARLHYSMMLGASIVIQSAYRKFRARNSYLAMREGFIRLGAVYRGRLQRRRYLEICHAVETLQCRYKAIRHGRICRRQFNTMRTAAVRIQSVYRGYVVRKDCRLQHQAALTMQKTVRRFMVRKRYLTVYVSIVKFQSLWRAYRVRKQNLLRRLAAATIQKFFRGYLERRKYERQRQAVILLQALCRGTLGRKLLCKKYESILVIQRIARGYLARRLYNSKRKSAVQIQRVVRGYLIRQSYNCQRNSAVQIQRVVRGYLARQWCCKQHRLATMVQKVVRGYLVRRAFKKQLKSVLLLQAACRSFLSRQTVKMRLNAVVKIQSWYKAVKVERKFVQTLKSARILQSWWRNIRLSRSVRQQFLVKVGAAVTIQSSVRGLLLRRQYCKVKLGITLLQSAFRMLRARRKYLQSLEAIVVIQRWIRASWKARYQRSVYTSLCNATVVIQRQFRANIIARSQRLSYLKQRSAAISIQQRFRANVIGRAQRLSYLTQQGAAIAIQQKFRACIIARSQRLAYLKQRSAAITIQRKFRSTLLARSQRLFYLTRQNAAITIQRRFKANVIARTQRMSYLTQQSAAIAIQRKFRACIIARSERLTYLAQRSAAIAIQQRFRANLIARTQRMSYLTQQSAAIAIQRKFRANVIARTQRMSYLMQKSAAIAIQQKFRACIIARSERLTYLAQRSAAIAIQQRFRANLIARTQRMSYLTQQSAAIAIQRTFRAFIIARSQRLSYLKQRIAAISIQQRFRANVIARSQRLSYLTQKGAAIAIQQQFRACIIARSERLTYLAQRSAAIAIQRRFRANVVAHTDRLSYLTQKRAAIVIQQQFRAFIIARRQRLSYLRQQSAAIAIQRKFRANVIARTQRMSYLMQKSAAIEIQQKFRACIIARSKRLTYLAQRSAAIAIQQRFRANLIARTQRMSYLTQQSAAIAIQRKFRAYVIARSQKLTYLRQRSAAIAIQQRFRANVIARTQRLSYLTQKGAAIVIQQQFRAFIIARRQRLSYLRQQSAAIAIQRKFRANVIARTQRMSYLTQKRAAIAIQRTFRAFIIARSQRLSYLKQRIAAISIQQRFRANVIARSQRLSYLTQKGAAIAIQQQFRACIIARRQRLSYLRQRNAAIAIQRKFRACLTSRGQRFSYLRQRNASIIIQKFVKRYLVQVKYRQFRRHVIAVQSVIRSWLVRKHFIFWQERRWMAATRIQAQLRGFLARRQLLVIRQQRAAHLVRLSLMTRKYLAVVRIQRTFRKYRFYLCAKHNINSLSVIQRWVRVQLLRRRMRRGLVSLCRLQSKAISWLTRRHSAAVVIQSVVRMWVVRRDLAQKNSSATMIQAYWRGFRLRQQVKDKKIHQARQKVQEAARNAKEENKLCHRTSSALDYLLTYRQLSQVLEAVINLDVVTRLSPQCCKRFVKDNAVNVLFTLIRKCNRSLPHMEIIKHSISILLNLSKYEVTAPSVIEAYDSIETLIDLLQMYREKGVIFTDTCMLLGILGSNPICRQMVRDKPGIVDKLRSIQHLTHRKHELEQKRISIKVKMAAATSYPNASHGSSLINKNGLQRIAPVWAMRRDTVHSIEDPLCAVHFLMTSLQISMK